MLDAIASSRLEPRLELLVAWKTTKRLTDIGGGGPGAVEEISPPIAKVA